MFIGLSRTLGKVGRWRIGVGLRLTGTNFIWMSIILMFVYLFKAMIYMFVFAFWFAYALFYGMFWCGKWTCIGIYRFFKWACIGIYRLVKWLVGVIKGATEVSAQGKEASVSEKAQTVIDGTVDADDDTCAGTVVTETKTEEPTERQESTPRKYVKGRWIASGIIGAVAFIWVLSLFRSFSVFTLIACALDALAALVILPVESVEKKLSDMKINTDIAIILCIILVVVSLFL